MNELVAIVDCSTGETIVREPNESELQHLLELQAKAEQEQTEQAQVNE